jgi:roadblock/LC7 domain-containing protein
MSIFDLHTDQKSLMSSNNSITKMEYGQVTATRDVTGKNFSNGTINFKFSNSGVRRWIPSKSYMRVRLQLTNGTDAPIDTAFGAAPNMGLCSNMFQSAEFRLNDKVVSRVGDFISQVDALDTRLSKSRSWLKSVGESTNWWSESQALRLAEVASDGKVVTDTTPVLPAETVTNRAAIGYAAQNTVAYVAATGVITFAAGGGAVPPNTNVAFAVGDYLILTGGAVGLNVKLEVLAVNANLTMTVRADIGTDVPAANHDFNRARPNVSVAPDSRQVGSFETIWQPPLSIFKVDQALPCGDYELVLNPQTYQTFQKRAIESVLGSASLDSAPTVGGLASQIKVKIVDMYLYCAFVDGPRVDDITYLLDLRQTRCQADVINNPSFGQKNFDVSPSTRALTLAYQDSRIGENTALSPAKFKSYENVATPTLSQELKLTRMYLNYAGQNFPAPDADPQFVAGLDYTTQRYTATQLYSGAYYDTGGCETLQEFHARGPYYHFQIPRDATDNSTRVTCHQGFQATTDVTNMRVLLFDHSSQVCRVTIRDGRVTSVELEDA